jgi:hypothetical protein
MNAQDPTGVDPDSPEGQAKAAARREYELALSRAVHEARGGRIDDGAVDSTGQLVREARRATQLDEDI